MGRSIKDELVESGAVPIIAVFLVAFVLIAGCLLLGTCVRAHAAEPIPVTIVVDQETKELIALPALVALAMFLACGVWSTLSIAWDAVFEKSAVYRRGARWQLLVVVVLISVAAVFWWNPRLLFAAEPIPAAMLKYRSEIIRAARVEAGLSAPVALFAAQVEQESGWNPQAVSPVGARGLGQFMPATAKDLGRTRPDLGPAIPTNPGWALRALVAYDLQLVRLVRAATVCDTWAMGITAYNEGIGNIWKEQALAKRQGLDPGLWKDVKKVNAGRSLAAFHESRNYWPGIQRRQPKYLVLGPGILCEVAR